MFRMLLEPSTASVVLQCLRRLVRSTRAASFAGGDTEPAVDVLQYDAICHICIRRSKDISDTLSWYGLKCHQANQTTQDNWTRTFANFIAFNIAFNIVFIRVFICFVCLHCFRWVWRSQVHGWCNCCLWPSHRMVWLASQQCGWMRFGGATAAGLGWAHKEKAHHMWMERALSGWFLLISDVYESKY